jgi:molybdenum cofactor cytidylyltransferase
MPGVLAVVLAAGGSTRMGTHKLVLTLDGEAIVRRTAREVCAAGFDAVLVVVGYEQEKVVASLEGVPVRFAVNPAFATGMGSSFRTAIEQSGDADAVMFALADQPFVTAREYRMLLDTYRAHAPAIVSVRYGEVTAPPHLFARPLFRELSELEHGARSILKRHADEMIVLQFPPELLQDIDTPEDYERAKRLFSSRPRR